MNKILGILVLSFLTGCSYVEPGYVGIKVNMYGQQSGVEDFPLQTGRVWYNPVTEDLYKYPTYMQHVAWTDDINEGSPIKEGITFNSSEGAQITMDIGLNYSLKAEEVPQLFVDFRQPVNTVTNTYLRNQVRDAFNRAGSNYKAVEIFGERKQEFLDETKTILQEHLEGRAFVIDSISLIGSPRADQDVMQSINMVIQATQRALEAENKVRQVEAEARQRVAESQGEAEAIINVAEAQAEANRQINESLTPNLIHYKMLEQWDGVAPRVLGGDNQMLLNIPTE